MSDPPGDKHRSPSILTSGDLSEAELRLSTPSSSEHGPELIGTPKELEPLGAKQVSTDGIEGIRDRHRILSNPMPKDVPVGHTKSVDA